MQVDMKRLDARIQKLQDVRRIAADPELVNLLLEFISTEDEGKEVVPPSKIHLNPPQPSAEDIGLVDQVLKGLEPQSKGAWNVKRA